MSKDSELAKTWRDREKAEMEEQAKIKEMTLKRMEQMEDEEIKGSSHLHKYNSVQAVLADAKIHLFLLLC